MRPRPLHKCEACGFEYELHDLPTLFEVANGGRSNSIAEYVYTRCPACGNKDWAEERRYFGFLGPKGFYTVNLVIALVIVAVVLILVAKEIV